MASVHLTEIQRRTACRLQRAAFVLTWGLLCAIVTPVFAQAVFQSSNLPSFAELEAAGARIGEIRILNLDIFDLQDPQEDNALFRLANKLHIKTRPGVIERQLLFKSGDRFSQRVMDETERVTAELFPTYAQETRLPHNQFIFILASTGLLGLILSLIGFIWPVFAGRKNALFMGFQVMAFASFLIECTLENAIGVAWFLFYGLWFLVGWNEK